MTIQTGIVVDDRYEIIRPLAEGGMGSVYLVREIGLERMVALKMLLDEADNEHQRLRFKREGQMLATLRHRNLVTCYRFGIWNSTPYITMEFLEGRSLSEFIRTEGRMPILRAVHMAMQVCEGMKCAHSAGIVHRDLKPGNIHLLPDPASPEKDLVKILDFGLARLTQTSEGQEITKTGAVIGTLSYMSPEQCLGKIADNRSDIYALGCVLYRALTGSYPFGAENTVALMQQHVNEPAPPLVIPGCSTVPQGLENVIYKAMEKNPDKRYQSMDEFARDLALIEANRGDEVSATRSAPKSAKKKLQMAELIFGSAIFSISLCCIAYQYNKAFGDSVIRQPKHPRLESRLIMDPKVSLRRIASSMNAGWKTVPEGKARLFEIEHALDEVFQRIPGDSPALMYHAHMVKALLYRRLRALEPASSAAEQEAGEYGQALSIIRETLGQNSRAEGVAYGFMGESALERNDIEKAEDWYKQALYAVSNIEPSTELELERELPGSEPANARAHYELHLGRCAAARKDYAKAEFWLRACIADYPQLFSDGLEGVKDLLAILRLAGKKAEWQKTFIGIQATLVEQTRHHVLTDDKVASAYAVLACASADTGDLERANELMNQAGSYLDSTAEKQHVNAVGVAAQKIRDAAKQQGRNKIVANLAKFESRLNQLR